MLPKQVKIGGLIYDVKVKDGPVVSSAGVSLGEITYRSGTIEIAGKDSSGAVVSFDQQAEVFWHEILHGIGYNRAIVPLWSEPDEELITAIARGLHAFMVDNGLTFPRSA